ncbi:MAG: tetratricopeptide repeat protein [Microcystaceae cyanobacterium]
MKNNFKQTGIENSSFGDNAQIEINQEINLPPSPKKNTNIESNLPLNTNNFVGRETELTAIHEILKTSKGVIVCAVEGLGGIGKSALALRYAEEYLDFYTAQYWIGLQVFDLATEVVKFAGKYLQIPENFTGESLATQCQWYWENWLPKEGNLLVILDNVSGVESIPEAALPRNERIKVLVTTRERNLNVQFESYPLETLPLDKCEELLRKIVGKKKVEKEKDIVAEICETVGYLPLGVELLGEYLSKKRYLSFGKLQGELNLKHDALNKKREYKEISNLGVIAAIDLTWQGLTEASQKVGMFLAVFAPTEIGWELIEEIGKAAAITEEELETAREELDNFHLIKATNEDCDFYTVHPLVREFFALQLNERSDAKSLYEQAFIVKLLSVAKDIPYALTVDKVKQLDPIIPHLKHLSETLLDEIPNPEDNLFCVFVGIARYYNGQGQYELAEIPYQRCVKEIKSRLGEDSEYYSSSLGNLAILYESQGRYTEAEPLYIRALSIDEQQLGENHLSIATGLNNLGSLYHNQGRYSEAEPLLIRALSITEQQLEENHPSTATSLNNLAGLYFAQRDYSEAEPLYIRALSIWEQQLGKNHPYIAQSLNNLAGLYHYQGRYSKAEPLYIRALSIREQQLVENHPDTAQSLNNLAGLYRSQGRYSKAKPLYMRAINILQNTVGNDHPNTQMVMRNYRMMLSQSQLQPSLDKILKEKIIKRKKS